LSRTRPGSSGRSKPSVSVRQSPQPAASDIDDNQTAEKTLPWSISLKKAAGVDALRLAEFENRLCMKPTQPRFAKLRPNIARRKWNCEIPSQKQTLCCLQAT
jgi:hypothetical protein